MNARARRAHAAAALLCTGFVAVGDDQPDLSALLDPGAYFWAQRSEEFVERHEHLGFQWSSASSLKQIRAQHAR